MTRTSTTGRLRQTAAAILAIAGLCCAVAAASMLNSTTPVGTGDILSVLSPDSAAGAGDTTHRATLDSVSDRWAPAPGITAQTADAPADPAAVDPAVATDPAVLEAYVDTLTVGNNGRFHGASRWTSGNITYRLSLPDHYPTGVADEVRTAYQWMAETSGITISEITSGHADINVVGYHHNGGLTRFDAIGGQLGNVTVSIGCCRRRPVWEEALHSMGLYSDRGPAGSLVSDYALRDGPVDVPTAADATALRALYDTNLAPGSGAEAVREALQAAASG